MNCTTCLFRISTVHMGKICNNPEAVAYRVAVTKLSGCPDWANVKEATPFQELRQQ